jgi:hypothetical protein
MIGLRVSGTAYLLALTALSPRPEAASAQYGDCGFPPYADDRRIALRQHIRCDEAKRALL